jgi:hypothetical protein
LTNSFVGVMLKKTMLNLSKKNNKVSKKKNLEKKDNEVMENQVKKVLSDADQKLILMVRD